MDCGLPGFSGPGDSPGKNTGVGYCDLLQGISPTQGSNTGFPHCTWILYRLNHHKTTLFLRGIQHMQRNEWVYPEDLMYSTVTILNNTLLYWDFLSMQGAQVQSLGGELRSCMPSGMAKNRTKQNTAVLHTWKLLGEWILSVNHHTFKKKKRQLYEEMEVPTNLGVVIISQYTQASNRHMVHLKLTRSTCQ